MTNFVESLHRLFLTGKITEAKVRELFNNHKITLEECKYILSK